jgi:ribose transport system substrate-binding protein
MKKSFILILIAMFVILGLSLLFYFSYQNFFSLKSLVKDSYDSAVNNNGEAYPTIAYVGFAKENQPFWFAMGQFVGQAALNRKIIYLDMTPKTASFEEQIKSLNSAMDQNVDGIILGANLPSKLTSVLDRAYDLKTPVVAIDAFVNHSAVVSFIATDNFESAKILGDYIAQATGGKGTLLILCGEKTHPNSIAREMGVKQQVEKSGMKTITYYADWQIEKAYKFTDEELSKPNNITAIFGCWDPGIISAEQVVENKGLNGKILLVGFDGLQETYHEILAGKISATMAQPIKQMAREGVEILLDYLANKPVLKEKLIPGILVTKDNVGYFLD